MKKIGFNSIMVLSTLLFLGCGGGNSDESQNITAQSILSGKTYYVDLGDNEYSKVIYSDLDYTEESYADNILISSQIVNITYNNDSFSFFDANLALNINCVVKENPSVNLSCSATGLVDVLALSYSDSVPTVGGVGSSTAVTNQIKNREAITIVYNYPADICTSQTLLDELTNAGATNIIASVESNYISCETYSRTNDGETCLELDLGEINNVSCVVGADQASASSKQFKTIDSPLDIQDILLTIQ